MKRYLLTFLIFFSHLVSGSSSADVKLKQKAILIYNFAQHTHWSNESQFRKYKIAILGNEQVYEELKAMEIEGRTIRGKRIRVSRVRMLSQLTDYQLVFVNEKFNYNIREVLSKAHANNMLVIGEGYGFNQSMINMIEIDEVFHFEINQTLLNREGFTVARAIRDAAITTSGRWQALYNTSKESLEIEQQKVENQEKRLKEQEGRLENQKLQLSEQVRLIDQRNLELERTLLEYKGLIERNEELKTEYVSEKGKLSEVRSQLFGQAEEIASKKSEIEGLDSVLVLKEKDLHERQEQIRRQRRILSEQSRELNYQRNYILFLGVVSLLLLLLGFFVFWGYRLKKKSEKALKAKNQQIELQKKELEIKNEDMEQFAYVASHDLQEPLNAITALTHLIDRDRLDAENRGYVDYIDDSTDRMRSLIRGLLEFSRLGSSLQAEKVDCAEILTQVLSNLDRRINETGAEVESMKLPVVMGHHAQLTSLFQNLISNALKFTQSGVQPLVSIEARPIVKGIDKFWQFGFHDNGIGIHEKHRQKIFTIFQRLHAAKEYEGTGIGLAHCKKIVDLHSGEIWVESTLGEGSSFYFTIRV